MDSHLEDFRKKYAETKKAGPFLTLPFRSDAGEFTGFAFMLICCTRSKNVYPAL
jgi:hypothetical protein